MLTRVDIIAIVIGLFAGYFLVSWAIAKLRGDIHKSNSSANAEPGSTQDRREAPRQESVRSTDAPRQWYEVLGVPVHASLDEIKLAYRHKIAQYHPDKTSGLGSELRALAEAKTKEINTAYDAALRAFSR